MTTFLIGLCVAFGIFGIYMALDALDWRHRALRAEGKLRQREFNFPVGGRRLP